MLRSGSRDHDLNEIGKSKNCTAIGKTKVKNYTVPRQDRYWSYITISMVQLHIQKKIQSKYDISRKNQ